MSNINMSAVLDELTLSHQSLGRVISLLAGGSAPKAKKSKPVYRAVVQQTPKAPTAKPSAKASRGAAHYAAAKAQTVEQAFATLELSSTELKALGVEYSLAKTACGVDCVCVLVPGKDAYKTMKANIVDLSVNGFRWCKDAGCWIFTGGVKVANIASPF